MLLLVLRAAARLWCVAARWRLAVGFLMAQASCVRSFACVAARCDLCALLTAVSGSSCDLCDYCGRTKQIGLPGVRRAACCGGPLTALRRPAGHQIACAEASLVRRAAETASTLQRRRQAPETASRAASGNSRSNAAAAQRATSAPLRDVIKDASERINTLPRRSVDVTQP